METAETLEIKADRLKQEMSRIKRHIEELDDIALSVDNCRVEHDLRRISTGIGRCLSAMETEIEPDEPWLAG